MSCGFSIRLAPAADSEKSLAASSGSPIPKTCVLASERRPLLQAIQAVTSVALELDWQKALMGLRHVCVDLLECETATLFLIDEHRLELR